MFGGVQSLPENYNALGIIINALFLNGLVPQFNNNIVRGGWYIGTTALFYLIAPFLFKIVKAMYQKKKKLVYIYPLISFVLSSVVLLIVFKVSNSYEYIKNCSFLYFSIVNQLPCILLGIILYFEYENDDIKKNNTGLNLIFSILFLCIGIVTFIADYECPVKWALVPFAFGIGFYLLTKALLLHNFEHVVSKALSTLGKNSLGIYLLHQYFAYNLSAIIVRLNERTLNITNLVVFPLMFIITIVLSCFCGKIFNTISKKISKKLIHD